MYYCMKFYSKGDKAAYMSNSEVIVLDWFTKRFTVISGSGLMSLGE